MEKDEAYWIKWFREHDTEAMVAEVIDLNHEIFDGADTLTEEQIATRGTRQAALVHELLECYDAAEVAEETGFTVDQVVALDQMHLATTSTGKMKNPQWN